MHLCWELDVCSNLYQVRHQFCCQNAGQVSKLLGLDHWKPTKRLLRYLQERNDHMLTYRRSDHLEIMNVQIQIKLDVLI